ncbi:MAG: outer membrane lipoprotein LolB [Lysobacteraceae bacterium]|nr:MAG: outer membrane lipoprotein LolB [Xanthomonadaceae bacterium]
MRLAWIAGLACMALAGCRTMQPMSTTSPAVDLAAAAGAQQVRAAALGLAAGDCTAPGWALAGRVALSNGKDGGSGQLEWTQGAGTIHMLLSAPITRQNWALEVAPDGATLRGVAKGPLHGDDAAVLLRDATGWDIPVAALGCWLRGAEADPARFGVARVEYGEDLLPRRIEQGGWTVDYSGWKPDASSRLPMPARINAQRGDSRVRLVVDRWGLE